MLSRRPTRSRLHLAIVTALLFCALAVVEFPELVNLKDDTSNDFTLLVSRQDVSSPNNTIKPAQTPVAIPVREVSVHAPISILLALSFPDTLANSPVDYLHLLCVHRT
jgi:YbbR domain-containing protein